MATKKEYTAREAAEIFGCTEGRICQICRWNDIGEKWGYAWRLTKADLKRISKALTFKGKNFQKTA